MATDMRLPAIGFVGLGAMGRPMALNLRKTGYPLTVYNRTPGRADALAQAGATVASSPADAAHLADVVITIVSDSAAVEAVILGKNGIVEGLKAGGVVIDMSTISPAVTRKIAAELQARGIAMLDAPVSGGVTGAAAATLSIMVGGAPDTFERCLPILQSLGKKITLMGPIGAGQTTKLCNQIIGLGTAAAVAEGLRVARAAGLDLEQIIDVINAGAAASWQLANSGKLMAAQDWRAGFRAALALKDMRLALDEARQLGLELPGAEVTASLLQTAVEALGSDIGYQAIARPNDGGEG
jgi:3-hydroxyisobutyrate dehydrogenase